jgi:hypothetical protein
MTARVTIQGAGQTPAAPTVGDTIWVGRTVAVPPAPPCGRRTGTPEPIERLGPPRITPHGDSTDVAYPIVVWRAGPLTIDVPAPLLLGAGGRIDSLPPQPVAIRIESVLPAVPADSSLAPQPRADFVPRTSTTPLPAVMLLAASVLLLAPLHWWWRLRGRPRPRPELPTPGFDEPPLERWADAGSRAPWHRWRRAGCGPDRSRCRRRTRGLDTEDLLRTVVGRVDWPLAELGDLLRSLDEARFGETAFPDAPGLARWADELAPRLVPEAA